jgi:hypothetical protein
LLDGAKQQPGAAAFAFDGLPTVAAKQRFSFLQTLFGHKIGPSSFVDDGPIVSRTDAVLDITDGNEALCL